ncbi:hypothetical protein [Niastella populi]|nr:hypothetical protein [Niastella populi]
MLKKTLKTSVALLFIGTGSFAQWGGSATTTGDTYRDGNVGIGTTTPATQLHINTQNYGSILLGDNSAGGVAITKEADSRLAIWNSGVFGQSQTERFTISASGSVGIGTGPNVIRKLTVSINSQNDGLWLSNTAQKDITLQTNSSQGAWNGLTQAGDHMLMWKTSTIDNPNAGALVIGPWCNGSKGLRITYDGNVGIGTANPGEFKLAVEGKIAARGVKVTNTSFADYVFDSTYVLRPLSNLENYINQNKHLPGIPSAKEVKKEGGFELATMNVKLLEKIEELTLYVIELKKENEQMKKEIKEIRKK